MEGTIAVFIPIIMLVSLAIVAIYFIVSKSNERKMLIEKGLSGEDLKTFLDKKSDKSNPYTIAKLSVIAMGVGLALLIGSFIEEAIREQVTFGMVLLFPGIGLFILYLFILKKEKQKDEIE